MKLLRLTVRNFGPYRGEQTISFPRDEQRNVFLVFGDNMRGKTFLLNALRFAIFGSAKGRRSETLDLASLANRVATRKGDWTYHAAVVLEANGTEFEVRRSAEPHAAVGAPKSSRDFRVSLDVRRGTEILSPDAAAHELNAMIPEPLARFFLFDAELLQEYEALLMDSGEQQQQIKNAIEQVLGVPAVVHGQRDLATLLRRAQQAQAREGKHVDSLRAQAEQQERLQATMEVQERDISMLQSKLEEMQAKVDAADAELAVRASAEKASQELKRIEAAISELGDQEMALRSSRQQALRDAWRQLLRPRLQLRMASVMRHRQTVMAEVERRGAIAAEIANLEILSVGGACPLCTTEISRDRRDQFQRRLTDLAASLAELKSQEAAFNEGAEETASLSRLLTSVATTGADLAAIEERLNRADVELTGALSRREVLRADLNASGGSDLARLRNERDARVEQIGAIKEELARLDRGLAENRGKYAQISALLSRAGEARLRRANAEVEAYGSLERLFRAAIDVLRDRLRGDVERVATEAFRQLTTEAQYERLRINDSYGLKIITKSGATVELRSAGAEQIVALSLIWALNRTSGKGIPMIVDTPLGRLDPRHREKVLRFVPDMATQVGLLVHDAEVDRERGLTPLVSRVGAAYEIIRVSEIESELRPLDALVSGG